ncbi:GerMN domain-containing protein [Alkaliphilus hydrothermalis]|uniref:Spore germination protein GerM n=1 Tax=Alkaliphilus hydrothermalis TaxID=1482730 RepID=A0ABS2NMQ7_9FIRM|nr:GerMN domain-containing protein [Alkaliphilus hydrothermalis]MBM7614187.1 spore germination protein GerM [Alkaliphilus hydrothermalis]
MFRAIRNMILLLVVCFVATGVPLYANTLNFSVSTTGVTLQNNLSMDVQVETISDIQQSVTVQLISEENPININLNPDNPLSLDLYLDDIHVKKIEQDQITLTSMPKQTLDSLLLNKENPMTIEFSIKQDKLDIPDGDYRLMIKPNIRTPEISIPTFNVALSFTTNYQYIPALQSIKNNETALTLYFTDPLASHLIPITRVIPYTNTPLRHTLDNLEKGPNPSLGLPEDSPIPSNAKLSLRNGIAGVYLPNDIGIYESYPTSARVAMESFIQSLTSIDAVDGVQFYFGNKIKEVAFHDHQVDKPFYQSERARIYIGTITETDRILLTPIPLYEESPTIELLFNKLKYSGQQDIYKYQLQPPLPEAVELVSHNLHEGILTLNLSEGFLLPHPEDNAKKRFMLEALLYTFTSLPDVEGVVLQVEGEPLSTFAGQTISSPLYPSKFINPEK